MRKIYILFILLITLSSFCYAAPPFEQELTFQEPGILTMIYPKFTVIPYNEYAELNVHVYNSSGYPIDNTTTKCGVHVYNDNGVHLFIQNASYHYRDFVFNVSPNDFPYKGSYSFTLFCVYNKSGVLEHGFVSEPFDVGDTRYFYLNTTNSPTAITLFMLSIAAFLVMIPMFKHDFIEGNNLQSQITNLIIRRGMYSIAIYIMMFNSAIMLSIVESTGMPLINEISRYMWLFGIAGWLALIYLGISTIFKIIKLYNINKWSKRI